MRGQDSKGNGNHWVYLTKKLRKHYRDKQFWSQVGDVAGYAPLPVQMRAPPLPWHQLRWKSGIHIMRMIVKLFAAVCNILLKVSKVLCVQKRVPLTVSRFHVSLSLLSLPP